MKQQVYSIRDQKVGMFNSPFFNKTHGEAERNFTELIRDDKSMPNKYPEDYTLYHLGTYDPETGLISSLPEPQMLIQAVSILSRTKQ